MTGFGEAEKAVPGGQLRVAIKTVNHRFFNPHLRTPQGFDRLEPMIQAWLKEFFFRGHVNLTLTFDRERGVGEESYPELDLDRARHYRNLLDTVREELNLESEIELSSLLRFNDLFRTPDSAGQDLEIDEGALREVTDEAAGMVVGMREKEGAILQEDLLERLRRMEDELSGIEARAPERLVEERDRLRGAIQELSEQVEVDEDRIAKEVAYLADRWDINEELVRFRAHLKAFRETLSGDGSNPVGKRLGFLVQEMHREANTIGSKANDVEMGHASVAIREEIERLREQLENVE